MTRHRAILVACAFALIVADGFWFYERYFAPNAVITYVGLDSAGLTVPIGVRASTLSNGKWDSDPFNALKAARVDFAVNVHMPPFAFVSLKPDGSYKKMIEVFRDLKARHICNVLVRESGQVLPIAVNFPNGPDRAMTIPAIVLCGGAVGDAGFHGTLPPDGPIHSNEPYY